MSEALSENYFDPQTIAQIEGLSLRVRHLVNGMQTGLHRSLRSGWSVEFAQHREYSPGDDPRHIDWKVFGRTDKYYVKRFEDDSRVDVNLLVDASSSMTYQGLDSALSKYDYAACLSCCLGWLAHSQNDRTSFAMFDRKLKHWLPPSDHDDQLQRIIYELEHFQPDDQEVLSTDLVKVFKLAANQFPSHGLTVLISDMFSRDHQMDVLPSLADQQNDIWLIHIMDVDEVNLPFDRPQNFIDLESTLDIDADPIKFRDAYRETVEEFVRSLEQRAVELGIRYQHLTTDKPINHALVELLS